MINNNSKINLTQMAKEAKSYGKEFTEPFRREGLKRLGRAEDLFVQEHNSDPKVGQELVDDLRDMRKALMTVHNGVQKKFDENYDSAVQRTQELNDSGTLKKAEVKPGESSESPEGKSSSEVHWRDEKAFLSRDEKEPSYHSPYFSLQERSVSRDEGVDDAPLLNGVPKFLEDLTQLIGVSAAAAALPSGPMALSVGSFAKDGMQVSTDERITSLVDDLTMRLDEMSFSGASEFRIDGARTGRTHTTIETPGFFWGSWVEERERENSPQFRTLETLPRHPERPWIPKDALNLYK